MNNASEKIVDIMPFIRRRDERDESNTKPVHFENKWSPVATKPVETISANALQKLDPDAELSKYFVLASKAISQLTTCHDALLGNDPLSADDALMASKNILAELLMYRNLSDAVALVVFKCFQAISVTRAVTDAPELPYILKQSLQEIYAVPFMKFEKACEIANKIEEVANPLNAPGYTELVDELIGDGLCEAQ